MRNAIALVALALAGCSSPMNAAAPFDAGTDVAPDVVQCDLTTPLASYSDDCVALADSTGCQHAGCVAMQAYRCDRAGNYSSGTPFGAVAGDNGVACAEQFGCARATRYDARCAALFAGAIVDADGGRRAEAYSCPTQPDGGAAVVNVRHDCAVIDGIAADGEAPVTCCP